MPNELFTIKPLEWRKVGDQWHCDSPLLDEDGNPVIHWTLHESDHWYLNETYQRPLPCASPEEGKRLAEEHWQEYVKQALVPVKEED